MPITYAYRAYEYCGSVQLESNTDLNYGHIELE